MSARAPAPESERPPSDVKAPELVLASTSSYRRALLDRLGVPWRALAPTCDESVLPHERTDPRALAERLAYLKAASVAPLAPRAAIIGCDQVVSIDEQILGKPGTRSRAIDQLATLAGRSHVLVTALCVIRGDETFRHTDVTKLRMRALSSDAVERYVALDAPYDCAGSYKLESRGIVLFEKIESNDHTAITGLPLIALVSILRNLAFEIP